MRTPTKPVLWALALIALPAQALAAATWCEQKPSGSYDCYFIHNASCQEVEASPHFNKTWDICFTGGALSSASPELAAFGKGHAVVMKGARQLTAAGAKPDAAYRPLTPAPVKTSKGDR